MTLQDYYKITAEKIGQYDTHSFRCKQWLVVMVGALVAAAFLFYRGNPEIQWPLLWAGILATILVFLIDMTFRHVIEMLINHAGDLEKEMAKNTNEPAEAKWGLTAYLRGKRKTDNNWRGIFRFIYAVGARRPRCILFYVAAVVVVLFGIWIPTTLSGPQAPDTELPKFALTSHPPVPTHALQKTRPLHKTPPLYKTRCLHKTRQPHRHYETQIKRPCPAVPGWLIVLRYFKVLLVGPLLVIFMLALMILWILCKLRVKAGEKLQSTENTGGAGDSDK